VFLRYNHLQERKGYEVKFIENEILKSVKDKSKFFQKLQVLINLELDKNPKICKICKTYPSELFLPI